MTDPVGIGRFVVVPAAYVLCLRPDPEGGEVPQVLLQLRTGTGFMDDHWAAGAAGHVERAETAYAAATREAAEELGIEPDLVFLTTLHRRHGPEPVAPIDERVDFFFLSTAWRGRPEIQEASKCADLRWFSLDALPEPVVPHEAAVLTELRRVVGPTGRLVAQPAPYLTHGF